MAPPYVRASIEAPGRCLARSYLGTKRSYCRNLILRVADWDVVEVPGATREVRRGSKSGESPEIVDEVRLVEVAAPERDPPQSTRRCSSMRRSASWKRRTRQNRLGVSPTSWLKTRMNLFRLRPVLSLTSETVRACGTSLNSSSAYSTAVRRVKRRGARARRARSRMWNLASGVSASSNRSRSSTAFVPHNASSDACVLRNSSAGSFRNGKAPPGEPGEGGAGHERHDLRPSEHFRSGASVQEPIQ